MPIETYGRSASAVWHRPMPAATLGYASIGIRKEDGLRGPNSSIKISGIKIAVLDAVTDCWG